MITFKTFLQENRKIVASWTNKNATLSEALEFLRGYDESQIEDIVRGNILFRGFSGKPLSQGSGGAFIDSSAGYRLSKDTNNAYMVLMDASKSLSDVPSRSKSLICTPSMSYASEFGWVHCIIPAPDTKIAYLDQKDFFDSQFYLTPMGLHHSINVSDLSADINKIFKILGSRSRNAQTDPYKTISEINAYFSGCTDDEIALAIAIAFMGDWQLFEDLANSIRHDKALTSIENRQKAFHTIVSATYQHSDSYSILKANQFWPRAATSLLDYLRNDSEFACAKKVVDVVDKVKGMGSPKDFFKNFANSVLTKNALGINMTTNLNLVVESEGECWFSGKALVMSEDVFEAVKTSLKKDLKSGGVR